MRYQFCLVFFLFVGISGIQAKDYMFSRITPEGGVAYGSVMCIGQDELGFIWFGTNNGLFIYDSKNIKRYATNPKDSSSIPTNRINNFYLSKGGRFWIATENGLCYYNRRQDSFERYQYKNVSGNPVGKDIHSFMQDKHGQYWLVDDVGVCLLDTLNHTVTYLKNEQINLCFSDEDGKLWFTSYNGGVYRYDDNRKEFVQFSKGINGNPRTLLVEGNNVWVGYENEGLICLAITNGEIKHQYTTTEEPDHRITNSSIRALTKDENGNIWAATYKGINIIRNFEFLTELSSQDMYHLPSPSVWSFFKDSEDNIWVGTWLGGLCLYNRYMNTIYHYTKNQKQNQLADNVISCFAEDADAQNLWIGTEGGGLYSMDIKSNAFKQVPLSSEVRTTNIKALAVDKFKTLWVGTYGNGIWYKKWHENSFNQFKTEHRVGWQIIDIAPTDKGIWFSNYSEGALYYSFKDRKTIRYSHNPLDLYSLTNNYIRRIIPDRKGNIWLASTSGLNLFVPAENKFYHFFNEEGNPNSLSNNFIYSLFEDKNGFIWIGTNGNGLNRYDPGQNSFEQYTIKDGLSGNEIYAIQSDEQDVLWISTEKGISAFNPVTSETRNMVTEAGIGNNQFNPAAAYRSKSGELFFGGSNGFIRFSPEKIKTNPVAPKAIITHFYINNREVLPDAKKNGLKDHISKTSRIVLRHNQNSFSFDFVATNYLFPSKNKFQYRLIGADNEWLKTDYIGKAIYTNISPGNYTFEVKASNNDRVWNNEPARIEITVVPPFWERWYAFIFYFMAITLLIFLIRKEIISKEKLKNAIAMEKLEHENEKKLNQLKLKFFTNISHEFRTPLTLILGPLDRLLKHSNNDHQLKEQLGLMKNNASRLLNLVTQIIDFRKVEAGKVQLETSKFDVVLFCHSIYANFKEHARIRNIKYSIDTDLSSLFVETDMEKLDKIIFNLLSNAFKNTHDNGEIHFKISHNKPVVHQSDYKNEHVIGAEVNNEFVEICVEDSGAGIDKDELPRVFERFYHGKEGYFDGVGIGLSLTREFVSLLGARLTVNSEKSKGSAFVVRFPLFWANGDSLPNSPVLNRQGNAPMLETVQTLDLEHHKLDELIKNKDALVLIVEDNPELSEYISDVLSPYYRTARSRNGKQGLEYTHSLYPDIIVSDIMMPEMNGCDLCKTIKNDIRTSHVPVILLTALNSVEDNISGLYMGADAYISKPFKEELLIVQIDNLIESRKRLRESFSLDQQQWADNLSGLDLDKKLILRAVKIVEKNLLEVNFSVEQLASEIGLSRAHLHRKLKSVTDQSASEFIRNIRLEKAVELMRKGEMKINEIGYAVGFNSHTYFTKSFKRHYGKSPQEYIKEKIEPKDALR
jgi:signal transduction histidine kinase/ligand-binding sensor domain-containing protein/DNA-binding response OmpR family regulator